MWLACCPTRGCDRVSQAAARRAAKVGRLETLNAAMNQFSKLLLVCAPLVGLAACGGSDTADRIDVADPVVRFVHASPFAPNVTLFRGTAAQSDATNVAYPFASNYFDVDLGISDWSVKTASGSATVGTVSIDPVRGTKYTIVALATSSTENSTYLITDPYNRSVNGDTAYVRVMNASFNAANIDLYMGAVGASIATASPYVAGTAYKNAGPASGGDSAPIQGGTYQVTITSAGTKTVLFSGQLSIGNSKDVLLLTVPDTVLPGAIKVLVKTEGTAGATELSPS